MKVAMGRLSASGRLLDRFGRHITTLCNTDQGLSVRDLYAAIGNRNQAEGFELPRI